MKSNRITFIFFVLHSLLGSQTLNWLKELDYGFSSDAAGVVVDKDGNSYTAGYFGGYKNKESGLYINKFSPSGELLWFETSGYAFDVSNGGGITIDSKNNIYTSIYVSGSEGIRFGNKIYPGEKTYILKYNSSGQLLWVIGEDVGEPRVMTCDSEDFIYVSGGGFTKKYNPDGQCLLTINYGTVSSLAVDAQGNIYVSGRKYNKQGVHVSSNPAWVITADLAGNMYFAEDSMLTMQNVKGTIEWTKKINYVAYTISISEEGNIYVAGEYMAGNYMTPHDRGLVVAKYNPEGEEQWKFRLPSPRYPSNEMIFAYKSRGIKTFKGSVFVGGRESMQASNGFLLRLTEPGVTNPLSIEENLQDFNLLVSPNPSSSIFNLHYQPISTEPVFINVYDAIGRIVLSTPINSQFDSGLSQIDLTGYPKGIYLLELTGNNKKESKKIVVE
jgi:hypothetical protein